MPQCIIITNNSISTSEQPPDFLSPSPPYSHTPPPAGCPHLTQQVWDESLTSTRPLRHFLDETCDLFPAYPAPFLQLCTGLCQGSAAAAAAYSYLCSQPKLVVEYGPGVTGLHQEGSEAAVLDVHMPWAKAPEVIGSYLPQVRKTLGKN